MQKPMILINTQKRFMFLLTFASLLTGLYAQTEFPNKDYWSFDAGGGMTDILVKGRSYQLIIDPKLWLSPPLMIGSRISINYSTDKILAFESQVYLRWNFLRLGSKETVNVFLQSGIGILAAYRGTNTPFSDVQQTRGSLILDAAAGVTIPLNSYWHIEPAIRAGYPHIAGVSLTAGYKFPYKKRQLSKNNVIKTASIESVMFGPDAVLYNADIDCNTHERNETLLDSIAKMLKKNPNYRVRIEGHANPVIDSPRKANRLEAVSRMRANAVAKQLRKKGVSEKQIIIIAFGGTRPVTREYEKRDENRRVELIVVQANND